MHAKAEAEALRSAFGEVMDSSLATKGDLTRVEKEFKQDFSRVEKELSAIRTELAVLKWMLGVVVAATVIPLLKPLLS